MNNSVFFVCAHPDDMIAGAGLGFVLQKTKTFDVHVIDFTHGERGLAWQGISLDECKSIRIQEEKNACALLGAPIHFLDEIDGEAQAGKETCEKMADLFRNYPPRAIITHWPIDVHVDHVMCQAAVMNACRIAEISPEIYFFEESIQTISMPIMHYVPFEKEIMEAKMKFIRCYACQNRNDRMAMRKYQEAQYHGWKSGCEFAECYGSFQRPLPGTPCFLDELSVCSKY